MIRQAEPVMYSEAEPPDDFSDKKVGTLFRGVGLGAVMFPSDQLSYFPAQFNMGLHSLQCCLSQ